MAIKIFNDSDVSPILGGLRGGCDSQQIASVHFRAKVPPVRSFSDSDQVLRLRGILGCPDVYEALGINSLKSDLSATFHFARGLETIGTLANLLVRGGLRGEFVANNEEALALSKTYLDEAFRGQYDLAEAHSSSEPWCDWFFGEGLLDETVLIGNRDEWWLLVVTDTD